MNIAIISSNDTHGGAAKAAYRLHKGLRLLDQCSVMIVKGKKSLDPNVCQVRVKAPEFQIEQNVFWIAQRHAIDLNRTDLSNTWFSLPYPGYDISDNELITNADIINLHWVAQFQSVETVARLLELGKPVVWTLHDENPYTGGCHYTAGCKQYRAGCQDCPQLKDNRRQIPFHILANKLKYWNSNLTIVTPSRWLAASARKSKVFRRCRVEVIPNSLETDMFKPLRKRDAKQSLKISRESTCILFVAEYHSEKRKGFRKLLEALKFCLKDQKFEELVLNKKIRLLTLGDPQQELVKLGIPVTSFGYLRSVKEISKAYSAADIFVLPSLEDNLPNTMLESMACGTPVIGFKVGGIPDMVRNGITGYVIPRFDIERMGKAILDLIFSSTKRDEMGASCRQLIEDHYKLEHQATAYSKLFKELTSIEGNSQEYEEIIRKNRMIILKKWTSRVDKYFFNAYKESAVYIIKQRNAQIGRLEKQLKQKAADESEGQKQSGETQPEVRGTQMDNKRVKEYRVLSKVGRSRIPFWERVARKVKVWTLGLYNYRVGRSIIALLKFFWRVLKKILCFYRKIRRR